MRVTNPLTAASIFAIYSLMSVSLSPKELSNQPLSPVPAPSPVQVYHDSSPLTVPADLIPWVRHPRCRCVSAHFARSDRSAKTPVRLPQVFPALPESQP